MSQIEELADSLRQALLDPSMSRVKRASTESRLAQCLEEIAKRKDQDV